MARHGPMVQRVCHAVLRDPHDADDAFQLTFMVLFQKAETITGEESLERWLCGVAYKTAARIRHRNARRRAHECGASADPADQPADRLGKQEVFLLVREELDQLPEKYRAPLILCYFEGLTHEESARHLGWAPGTVKVRLVRGRKLLRERLDRRKVSLGAGLLWFWKHHGETQPADVLLDSVMADTQQASAGEAVHREDQTSGYFSGRRFSGRAAGSIVSLVWALMLALGVAWSISWGVAVARTTPPHSDPMEDLPANLRNVLAVDCR